MTLRASRWRKDGSTFVVAGRRRRRWEDDALSISVHPAATVIGELTRMPGGPAVAPLLLVDGHQLLYRARFASPARITSREKSRDLTRVFGFLALARKAHLLHGLGSELVVVFDGAHAIVGGAQVDVGNKANRAGADHTPIKSLPDVNALSMSLGLAGSNSTTTKPTT